MSVHAFQSEQSTVFNGVQDEKTFAEAANEGSSNFISLDVNAVKQQTTTIGLVHKTGQQFIGGVTDTVIERKISEPTLFKVEHQINEVNRRSDDLSTESDLSTHQNVPENVTDDNVTNEATSIFQDQLVTDSDRIPDQKETEEINNFEKQPETDRDVVYNAEWDGRTSLQENFIATIDTINGTRNLTGIVGTSATFPSLVNMPKASLIAGSISAGASFMYLLTGAMTIIVCIASLIPLGLEELKNASKELKTAYESKIQERIIDAAEALQEAKLCLANFIGALFMGISQIVEGAVSVCTTPLLTKALHIHAFASASLKTGLITGSSCALGGTYVLRGLIQAYRAVKNLNRINRFYHQFKSHLNFKNRNLDQPIEFLNAKQAIGNAYWGRRVDGFCLQEKNVTVLSTEAEKIKHLQEVDKGIYSLQLKNRISLFVAAAMLVGGVISIVLGFVTAGIAPLIFGLVCFVAFTCMEYIFLTSDVTSLYKWLLNRTYVQSRELTEFLQVFQQPELNSEAVI